MPNPAFRSHLQCHFFTEAFFDLQDQVKCPCFMFPLDPLHSPFSVAIFMSCPTLVSLQFVSHTVTQNVLGKMQISFIFFLLKTPFVLFSLLLCPSCFPPSHFPLRSYLKCLCLREAFHDTSSPASTIIRSILPLIYFHNTFSLLLFSTNLLQFVSCTRI